MSPKQQAWVQLALLHLVSHDFFFATITVLPLALYFERNNFAKIFSNSKLLILTIATGIFLFLGMGLQQYALQVSQISNVAFITTLYVPIVGIISRFVF